MIEPVVPAASAAAPSGATQPCGACALSVVVPVFNEEQALPLMHQRLLAALRALPAPFGERFEIVYVDDGSRDGSAALIAALQRGCRWVSRLHFSRNFGKEVALTAGLAHARGQVVIVMDADLQHPPESIAEMLHAYEAGADVVNMRRRSRADETWLKRRAAGGFYRLINRLSDVPIPADVGDFRLLSRRAVDTLNQMPERNRFMKGLFAWIGFRQVTLEYDCAERVAGETKWHFRQLWRFAIEGITAFSVAPLRLASKLGMISAVLAFAAGAYFIARTLVFGDPVQGFPTLIVAMLMLGGLQLMAIGLLGEYLGRLSVESKARPLFIIDTYEPAHAVQVPGR